MDKIVIEDKVIKTSVHSFYCDDCKKFLLKSVEYEDGYIEEPKAYYIQHVALKGHYCKECAQRRIDDVVKYARSKGFDIEGSCI